MNNAGFLSTQSVRENQLANLSKQIDELKKENDRLEDFNEELMEERNRLNNIINELEEEYINYMDKQDFAKKCKISRPYLDKLLKGMTRKEIYEFCKQRNKIKEL